MATKTKKTRKSSKKSLTIPLGIVGGFAPGIIDTLRQNGTWRPFNNGTGDDMVSVFLGSYFGIQTQGAQQQYMGAFQNKTWNSWRLKYGLYPLLAGFAAHIVANKIGLNRAIARAGVPYVRI